MVVQFSSSDARGPIRYIPVTLLGKVIGFLWASAKDDKAHYERRLGADGDSFDAAVTWSGRMNEAEEAGLTPLGAMRRWAGAPPDARAGRIADAAPDEAPSYAAFTKMANPGYADPREDLPPRTDHPVHYVPVVRAGRVLGFLWASVEDESAAYMPRRDAGREGMDAMTPWMDRLREARDRGLTPRQALLQWAGSREDAVGGAIPADVVEDEAPDLETLRRRAGWPATPIHES